MGALLVEREHGCKGDGNEQCDSILQRKGFVLLTAASEKKFL